MSCKTFAQLQEFLRHAEVTALYSSICKLQRPKLEEALRIRGLSSAADDESTLRVRLLYFEVQFYHPEIGVPDVRISEEEATALRARVDALRDLAKMICAESVDATLRTKRTERAATEVKPLTDSTVTATDTNADTEHQVKYRLNCVKLLKVCDLQYSGARGLPAQDFLESLEDFRRFSKVDDRALLEILPCVLDPATRKWYRASNFADWSSFERKFVEDHVSVAKGPRTPVGSPKPSRTLQQLKDSLLEIGFNSPNASSSRRTSVCSDASTLPHDEAPKVATTTRSHGKTLEEIRASLVLPIASQSAEHRESDDDSCKSQLSGQAPVTFSRTIGSGVQILKRSDVVATRNNAIPTNNNNNNSVATSASVNIPKPATYATVNPGYAYGPMRQSGAASLSQNYGASQALNCPYGAYRYANEYYVPNGYGHY